MRVHVVEGDDKKYPVFYEDNTKPTSEEDSNMRLKIAEAVIKEIAKNFHQVVFVEAHWVKESEIAAEKSEKKEKCKHQ